MHTKVAPISGLVIALLALAVPTIMWVREGWDLGLGLTALGVGVSVIGVVVAALIYLNQQRQSTASEARIVARIEAQAVGVAAADTANGADDFFDIGDELLTHVGSDAGKDVRRLARDQIPLELVRDLVLGWDKSGQTGSWSVGALLAAFRRTGRGNRSWFVITQDPRGGHERLFKIARGGRGNSSDDVTVTEVNL